jgi:hypothetical protein
MHLFGMLKDIQPAGTELSTDGADAALVTANGEVKGRLSGVRLALGDAVVGREAYLTTV